MDLLFALGDSRWALVALAGLTPAALIYRRGIAAALRGLPQCAIAAPHRGSGEPARASAAGVEGMGRAVRPSLGRQFRKWLRRVIAERAGG